MIQLICWNKSVRLQISWKHVQTNKFNKTSLKPSYNGCSDEKTFPNNANKIASKSA